MILFNDKFTGNSPSQWFANYNTRFEGLSAELPPNVHLMTLRTIETGETVLRLWHIFAVGEDPVYSKRVAVNLAGLFNNLFIVDIREMSLTSTTPIRDVHRYTWKTSGEEGDASKEPKYPEVTASNLVVELEPMDIRTFVVRFQGA